MQQQASTSGDVAAEVRRVRLTSISYRSLFRGTRRRRPERHTLCGHWLSRLWVLMLLAASMPLPVFAEEALSLDQVQSGSLLLKMRDGYEVATRINSDIELSISGMVVRATLRQRFRNDGSEWVEGVYVFPLPESAAVDRMRFRVGERIIEGEIQEKAEARKTYEAARRAGKRASLVNQQRANLFTSRLAHLGPGETIEIEIEYLDTAVFEDGEFSLRIPTTLTPRYIPGGPIADRQGSGWSADTDRVPDASLITPPQVVSSNDHRLSLNAVIDAGMPLERVVSRYHPITVEERGDAYELGFAMSGNQLDHDIELTWRPLPDQSPRALVFSESVDDATHLMLMFMPPTEAVVASIMPRELIFVIDTSGSMHGISIEQARKALLFALNGLRPVDRFNVIQFNSTTSALFAGSVPADGRRLDRARDYVRRLKANGGTEMRPALRQALGGSSEGEFLKQVIFITDGSVGNEAELFSIIERELGASRLFTVGIGSAPNSWFMSRAAELGRGTEVTISAQHEVQEKMQRLFNKLERPQVTDISVEWPSNVATTAYPTPVPDLYAGEPVVVKARIAGGPQRDAVVTVNGRSASGTWTEQVALNTDAQHAGTAAVWARAHIDSLLDQRRRGGDADVLRAKVVETALQHHLVSEFTSLVAVDKTPVRTDSNALKKEQVPNLLPYGQDQQAIFGFPATATDAPLARRIGALCLLLAVMLLLTQWWQRREPSHAAR